MPAWTKPIAADVKEKRPPAPSARHAHVRARVDSGACSEPRAEPGALASARFLRPQSCRRITVAGLAKLLAQDAAEGDATRRRILLLDLRGEDCFAACHINGASCYPARRLSHACNPFSAELLAFANAPGCVIILYDLGEQGAAAAAALLFQRGIDNVAVLAGGVRDVAMQAPSVLSGPPPQPPELAAHSTAARRRARSGSGGSLAGEHAGLGTGSAHTGGAAASLASLQQPVVPHLLG